MVGYRAIETAIITKLIEKFPGKLSASRCTAGDPDSVFDAMFSENERFGCWTELDGGSPDRSQPFSKQIWEWRIIGIMAIRISDTIEDDLRDVVTDIATLFADDHTLGGIVPRVRVVGIDTPVPAEVNSIPFYWVGFSMDAFDM